MDEEKGNNSKRKPQWLKIKLPGGAEYARVSNIVKKHGLHTICSSGNCPNMGECWNNGTATFMILGNICTRSCKFCNVTTGKPFPPDLAEPLRLAETIRLMALKHAVITSVDRDDLDDKGADFWATTIQTIKVINPSLTLEVLIPDFDGIPELIDKVIAANPEIISHNLETVQRLTPLIRSRAKYHTSLSVIKRVSESGLISKSGLMLGLGERKDEILETMDDLRRIDCKVLTIGQYLQPTHGNFPVIEYITPDVFDFYKHEGLKRGFMQVESAPLVRSSYHAENVLGKGARSF